jgi:multisubunit Na+/H+ antiporter MnhF subunit
VVGSALALLQAVIAILQGYLVAAQIVDIAIALAILAYLNTSTVRRAFGRKRSGAADQ